MFNGLKYCHQVKDKTIDELKEIKKGLRYHVEDEYEQMKCINNIIKYREKK
jgi:hypothetical protein